MRLIYSRLPTLLLACMQGLPVWQHLLFVCQERWSAKRWRQAVQATTTDLERRNQELQQRVAELERQLAEAHMV